ncbi:MAG: universal stress protein [Chloroflexota bacterium]
MANSAVRVERGFEYERILVPVSGDSTDREAIKLACSLARSARRSGCKLLVLYVVQVRRSLPLDAHIEAETQKAEQTLGWAENVASAECDCDVETDLLQARDVGVAIVDEAMEREADLIVMGAGYKKRFGVPAVSPTALTVLRDAPCHVVIIRPRQVGADVEGK